MYRVFIAWLQRLLQYVFWSTRRGRYDYTFMTLESIHKIYVLLLKGLTGWLDSRPQCKNLCTSSEKDIVQQKTKTTKLGHSWQLVSYKTEAMQKQIYLSEMF